MLPERDTADAFELHFSFQHLFDLSFLWSLLDFFSTDQINTLWGQDQISLDGL